jgi:two-component system, NtrC family, sensor kinase
MTALSDDFVADLRHENARLQDELRTARDRQDASAEILRVIGQSPADVQPVFDAIVLAAARLLGRDMAFVLRCDGATYWCTAMAGPEGSLPILDPAPVPIDPDANFPSRAIVARKNLHLPDWSVIELPEYEDHIRATYGISSALYLPLMQGGECIGVLGLAGKRAGSLGESEIALAESFRDQALIAIENVRLFNETREALERQNASAEILRTIAGAPGDAERALRQIAETSARLFGAPSATIHIAEGDGWARTIRFGASSKRIGAGVPDSQLKIGGRNMPGTIVAENCQVHVPDLDNVDPAIADWPGLPYAREAGTRSMSGSPLRREGKAIGALIVYRDRLAPFTAQELAVQQTFADQAAIAIENARLFNETREALERQTATAEILKVIASSPSDTTPVFEAIATSANRLLGGFSAAVFRFLDDNVHLVAFTPVSPVADAALKADFPKPVDEFEPFQLARQGKPFPIPDTEQIPYPPIRKIARLHGFRSMLFVPLMNSGVLVGIISVTRLEPGAFSPNHIQLLQTFADQAVIAVENTRLFNETQEALERQTATADILKVIASSPTDVQPVFDAIAASANRLIGGFSATVMLFVGDVLQLVALTPTTPAADEMLQASFPRPLAEFPPFELVRDGKSMQFPDTESEDVPPVNRALARSRGYRGMLFTPLMSKGAAIGILSVTRKEPGAFAAHHVQLLQTFADQAVIAIENVRLFEEVQEALERQTATADILKVIASSPDDVQPVFDAIATSSKQLLGGFSATVFRFVDDVVNLVAYTPISPAADQVLKTSFPRPTANLSYFEFAKRGEVVQEADSENNPDAGLREVARARGFRSSLFAPLMSKGAPIGLIVVTRKETGKFADHHVQLLQTFADQAVIAIENVRLFDEVQAKTRDLTEALTYQTGSSNILKVIASSPTDVEPVLRAIVESACELCDAYDAAVLLRDGEELRFRAHHGPIPISFEKLPTNRQWTAGRAFVDRRPVHVHDLLAEGDEFPLGQELSQRMGHRSILSVPLLREGESIGTIVLRRTEVHPFTDKQIALLQTFADQAVIALGNVRLFEEVQARTEDLRESLQQQTATADVLKVISRSAFDLDSVLDTLVESAARLSEAENGIIARQTGSGFHAVAGYGHPAERWAAIKKFPIEAGRGTFVGRAIAEGRTVHVPDVLADPEFEGGIMQQAVGYRSVLCVPLLREGVPVGVIGLARNSVRPFSDKQIELVSTFADQAVIAIENVRLFDEVQARTRELAASLDDLRTAQDRLVQTEKLASLGQLTAGIAHEIKNPLNFVNNFASLSAELTDELNDVLKSVTLTDKVREEIDELTQTLKDNLERVVQHGKRADSIVKNMLLHSREGSGDHRPADINALLDESLNLAYHGARAEKREFNVTLQRDFDALAGTVEVFPQEITRVFLNLIANGFYAVTKRKLENGSSDFEPMLRASTKGRGDAVEIRIRDNGTGIPAEVREKMFNPFFTTKPAGEGTGLGLSMSHDIIVKQHGGSIDVETEPGQFTEFTIVLPRTSTISNKIRGQT